MKNLLPLFTFFLLSAASFSHINAQTVSFALKTTPNVNFDFNTIEKYQKGIIIPSFLTLRVESPGAEWDLYVGTTTTTNGFFDVNNAYGSSGNSSIPVNILQARVYNTANTTQTGTSFFNLSDISSPNYIIGSSGNDPAAPCGVTGANAAGSYNTQPQCYTFKVDLKATPGLNYRAGSYSLRVDFILMQDL
ncbi:hypothetical protein [Pedobacter sp. SYSU D00535]|uniref:hypothetical protein n=1 Tax=Pedobacter sp. SYSU D00535 TaxID=2810308 RepID=UPI001A974275|nr:hypothetical protein [Pedobacter sp. SYSU D00535]